jgi:glycosyltransferase involved in cell wall biosynthesis
MTNGSPLASPRVCVCIPVYNCAAFLRAAVDSVLRQTHRSLRLVVIDNCSTDGTLETLTGIADPRLEIHRNRSNLGMEGNWNRALELADGEYLKLLPADDLLDPDCLEKQVRLFDELADPGVVMVSGGRHVIDDRGRRLLQRGPKRRERFDRDGIIRRTLAMGTNPIGEPGAVLMRTEAARRAGRFDQRFPYMIDLDFWLKLLQLGDIVMTPEPLCSFRVSKESTSVDLSRAQNRQFVTWMESFVRADRVKVSPVEIIRSRLMAFCNMQARRMVYRFMLG